MPSEGFGFFAQHVPACFALLGNGLPGGAPLHSREYDVNDAILPAGVAFYLAVARAEIPAR